MCFYFCLYRGVADFIDTFFFLFHCFFHHSHAHSPSCLRTHIWFIIVFLHWALYIKRLWILYTKITTAVWIRFISQDKTRMGNDEKMIKTKQLSFWNTLFSNVGGWYWESVQFISHLPPTPQEIALLNSFIFNGVHIYVNTRMCFILKTGTNVYVNALILFLNYNVQVRFSLTIMAYQFRIRFLFFFSSSSSSFSLSIFPPFFVFFSMCVSVCVYKYFIIHTIPLFFLLLINSFTCFDTIRNSDLFKIGWKSRSVIICWTCLYTIHSFLSSITSLQFCSIWVNNYFFLLRLFHFPFVCLSSCEFLLFCIYMICQDIIIPSII